MCAGLSVRFNGLELLASGFNPRRGDSAAGGLATKPAQMIGENLNIEYSAIYAAFPASYTSC
jgi:hypothetical protein